MLDLFRIRASFCQCRGEHGILDLLTVARSGRLAVIELKSSEHIHLPLQAADYWLRVRRQLQSGEIARYGYFHGVALQQAPPLVYLIAPALRFHPATDDPLKYLSAELEVARVGFAESWRRDCAWSCASSSQVVHRPHRRSATEFSGIQPQRNPKPLSVENRPEKERSG